jgi:hypothetical protein
MKRTVQFTAVIMFMTILGSGILYASGAKDEQVSGAGPLVTGPIKGGERGYPFHAYFGDIGSVGYVEEEYFIEGTGIHYEEAGDLGIDGKWVLKETEPAPYKTRILIHRPKDPAKFNGTVIVEWLNVSFGYELAFHEPAGIYENGFAYAAVSAQPTGIDGFPSNPQGLKVWDKERYGSLHISDDGASYDVFTQAAYAIGPKRRQLSHGADPMGGLEVKKLIAVGASQSGNRILAYINGVQPVSNAFDALIPAICAGMSADFDKAMGHPDPGSGDTGHSRSLRTQVRDDLTVPVLHFNTQTEAFYYGRQRQPETNLFRSWEIAGSTHMPKKQTALGRLKTDRDGVTDFLHAYSAVRFNEVEWLPVFDAAILHVHKWITSGVLPPQIPPVQTEGNDYAYDKDGNVLGGARLPELEVPTALYVAGATYPLTGFTVPFSPAQLKQLYPTHQAYIEKVRSAAVAALNAGIIQDRDVEEYVKAAEIAPVPEEILPEVRTENRAVNER